MSITTSFGGRYYEFCNQSDVIRAKEIWAKPCNQEQFERLMEESGIDFLYDLMISPETFYDEIDENGVGEVL